MSVIVVVESGDSKSGNYKLTTPEFEKPCQASDSEIMPGPFLSSVQGQRRRTSVAASIERSGGASLIMATRAPRVAAIVTY